MSEKERGVKGLHRRGNVPRGIVLCQTVETSGSYFFVCFVFCLKAIEQIGTLIRSCLYSPALGTRRL